MLKNASEALNPGITNPELTRPMHGSERHPASNILRVFGAAHYVRDGLILKTPTSDEAAGTIRRTEVEIATNQELRDRRGDPACKEPYA